MSASDSQLLPSASDPVPLLEELEARRASIAERLSRAETPEARAGVKGEIVAFFREVDALHGRLGELRGRVRELVEEYRRASGRPGGERPPVHHDRLNSSSFVERGWNFIAAEKYPEAVDALERALALAPGNLEAEGLLAWAMMKSNRLESALSSVRRVLLADPANEMARVNLGFICYKRRIYGEAIQHLTRAIELGRDRKATLYASLYLGLVHAERNDFADAVAWFKRSIEAGPNLMEAYYHLGLLLYRKGRAEQARAVWETAVARSAFNPYSKKARALLEAMESGQPIAVS